MNVFVLCTGRCGSTTFARACRHITNFSSAHESRVRLIGSDRLDYADQHIEADNRLSWFLGRLDGRFGRNAFYVHLKRDTIDTAQSYAKRYRKGIGITKAYRSGILSRVHSYVDPVKVCVDYCNTVNANIKHFLKDKPHCMSFELKNAEHDFKVFWEEIGAEGSLDEALLEWSRSYNASEGNVHTGRRPFGEKVASKMARAVANFPRFLKYYLKNV